MKGLVAIGLLLLPLSGCIRERGETGMSLTQLSEVLSGGGSAPARAPAPAQPAPGSQAPGTGAAKMLEDPEAEGGPDSDYVWASSPEQAQRMCERMAAGRGNRLDGVQPASNWTNNAGMKRYVCYMTVFGR